MTNRLLSHSSLTTLLIRFTLGPVFIVYGINKLSDYLLTVKRLGAGFVDTWLPMSIVTPIAYLIPPWELLVGLLLTLGLFYRAGLIATAVLMCLLIAGVAIQGNAEVVGRNMIYVIALAIAFRYCEDNPLSIDALRQR